MTGSPGQPGPAQRARRAGLSQRRPGYPLVCPPGGGDLDRGGGYLVTHQGFQAGFLGGPRPGGPSEDRRLDVSAYAGA